MKGSELIVRILEQYKIRHVFEYPGGATAHILDALSKSSIEIITMRHEQSASFASDAYGRITNSPSVCMATSGPGATNLITGIANAWCDSIPMVVITGQVNTHEITKTNVRQTGFQEIDIVSIVRPITKYAITITSSSNISEVFSDAFRIANSGRKGPVLIDIPMDIQANICTDIDVMPITPIDILPIPQTQIDSVALIMKTAKKPMFLLGGGTRTDRIATNSLLSFYKIPYVCSLNALDIPKSSQYKGMIGWTGHKNANTMLQTADVVIVLGARLDIRQTGNLPDKFAKNAKIVHVDIDNHRLNNRVKVDIAINSSITSFVQQLQQTSPIVSSWDCNIREPEYDYHLKSIINTLNINLQAKSYIATTDVGQHQLWTAQSLKGYDAFLTSAGLGTMGYGIPAAIGAHFATHKEVYCFTGDGSIQMNIQELEVIKNMRLPIKIVLFNNNCLGLVRQFQDTSFCGVQTSTVDGYSAPRFKSIVEAYDIKHYNTTEIVDFVNSKSAGLLEITLPTNSVIRPILMGGKTIDNQD